MGKMAAGRQTEAHESVAGRHQRYEGRGVGGRPGVRLDICEFASKKPRNPFYRHRFRDVHELATAVITPAGQALGIFIGENRPLGLQNGHADDVFRSDKLDLVPLALKLAADDIADFRIALGKTGGEERGLGRRGG